MLAAYILCCLLRGTAWAQWDSSRCSQLSLHIRSSRASVSPGGSTVLVAKLANTGTRTVSGIGVRLDLPTGLVARAKPGGGEPLVVNGGATAYWTELTVRPGKRRVLKLKARACGSATPGGFPLGGAVYVINATSDVTCLSAATTMKPAVVRTQSKTETTDVIHIYIYPMLTTHTYLRTT